MRWHLDVLFLAVLVGPIAGCSGGEDPPPPDPAGTIVGEVLAEADGAAIAGATVTTEPATVTATTAADGSFTLAEIDPGTYEVRVSAEGFEAAARDPVTVRDGDTTTVDFSLVAMVLYASTCQSCHLQSSELLASLADDPLPEDPNEGGSAGEG